MKTHKRILAALVLVLLAALFIRAHHITELAAFIDEDNHLRRAAWVYEGERHPAQESHGKFLLYFLLGVFDLSIRETALHLGRTMVALSALLTCALVFVTVKRLADAQAALLATAFYAFLPYAFFYERMALADPWAGTLGALTLYLALRLAEKPSYKWAALAGLSAALTVAAKLTMAFAVFFLPLALLILGQNAPFRDKLRRALPLLMMAGAVFVLFWLPIVIPARLSLMDENQTDFILVNTELAASSAGDSLLTKFGEIGTKFSKLASLPMALVLLGLTLAGLRYRPRLSAFLLLCLGLAWLPVAVAVQNLQTRYLMSGAPLVAVLMGVGLHSLRGLRLSKGRLYDLAGAGLVIWVLLFSIPFAITLMRDPPAADVPALDAQNYFWDRYNAYGNREALAYLQELEPASADVRLFALTKMCRQLNLYPLKGVRVVCLARSSWERLASIPWREPVERALDEGARVYVLTSEQLDVPPPNPALDDPSGSDSPPPLWELVAEFPKPFAIQRVYLWRVAY